ncbi:MAG: hypothetical protein AAGJ74_09630 [Pseudomonadota bacterium]
MPFIRPEAAAGLSRWREAIAGLGAVALGLYWLLGTGGALPLFGGLLTALGVMMIYAGIQRARFRRDTDGAGMVEVKEGQLAYFGPTTGGVMDIAAITQLSLHHPARGPATWGVRSGDEYLAIPVGAAGAEKLFDVFSNLPGLDTHAMLAALNAPGEAHRVLWEKAPRRLH